MTPKSMSIEEMIAVYDLNQPAHKQYAGIRMHGMVPNIVNMAGAMLKVLHRPHTETEVNTLLSMITSDMLCAVAIVAALDSMPEVNDAHANTPAGEQWATALEGMCSKLTARFAEALKQAVTTVILPMSDRATPEEMAQLRADPKSISGRMHLVVPVLRMMELISHEEYITISKLRDEALDVTLLNLLDELPMRFDAAATRMN